MRKNKREIYLLLLTIGICSALFSCSDRPSNVLSEGKMVSLMADMEIMESYVNSQMGGSSKEKMEMGEKVLEYHGVSKESLDTTLAWYGRNMDEYSDLFEKVDKEILKRKNKYIDIPAEVLQISGNLWPYSPHLYLSSLSEDDSFVFSLSQPEIEKGDIVKFSFFLPNASNLKGNLGVEYEDGYGEAVPYMGTRRNLVEVELVTDTAKKVARIYGVMNFKDNPVFPIYIDSIAIRLEPYDSLSYVAKRRPLKAYGKIRPQKAPIIKDTIDTIDTELKNILPDSEEAKSNDETLHSPDNRQNKFPRKQSEFVKLENNN